jgi:hypothetical protein
MNDSKPTYGNLVTGKVIPAHVAARKTEGDTIDDQLMPDNHGSVDSDDWVPGVFAADGKFQPDDQTKRAASGVWVIEFQDFARGLPHQDHPD